MASAQMTAEQIAERVRALGPWFHNLHLGGVQTAPQHFLGDFPRNFYRYFAHALPADLSGKSVLDVGCNGGFYCIEMARRGARRVVGLEPDARYLEQARFATRLAGVEVELHPLSVYQVGALRERFDVVLFLGVLYHLRHPLLALDLLHDHVARDLLVFQTMQRGSSEVREWEEDYGFREEAIFDEPAFPRMAFIEKRYAGDWTNWWVPNRACTEAMLRSAGFAIEQRVASEVYLCRWRERRDAEGAGAGSPGPGEER